MAVIKKRKKNLNEDLVPPKHMIDGYISREFNGVTEFDIYTYARNNKVNVLNEGPTGLGKTSSVVAWAAQNNIPFYSVPSNVGVEPSSLFGKYIPGVDENGENKFVWVDGPVTRIVRDGGVLLINEVNFLPPRVATVLFGLLDKRRQIQLLDHKGEVIDAHDDLTIIADMNPGYEGTGRMNKAFRNRFGIQLVWDYSADVEKQLIQFKTVADVAKRIRNMAKSSNILTPVSTNMLMEFESNMLAFSVDFASMIFVNHFDERERAPISQILTKTFRMNIEEELKLFKAKGGKTEVKEAKDEDFTMESAYPPEHPIWEQRKMYKFGDIDPEYGEYGVDWVLGAE